jgi:tagatose 6-phosphate kinase
MILCVNLNAAVDRTLVVDNFTLDAIHRPGAVLAMPGGKGCNVARTLHSLGEGTVVTGWVGGYAGRFIESGLRAEGIQAAFVHTGGESRQCLSVLDPARHTTTEVYERGEPIACKALAALRRRYRRLLPACRLVTLSGSLPAQVPADIYADLIADARRAGVPAFLDTSGDALRLGLTAGPDLVKPNRSELSALLGRDLAALSEVAEAARALARQWNTRVVVSLGADGAVATAGDELWYAQTPPVATVSAVGSGDAMLAGLATGIIRSQNLADSLRLGTAAGAANTLCLGAGCVDPADIETLLPQVLIQTFGHAVERSIRIGVQ